MFDQLLLVTNFNRLKVANVMILKLLKAKDCYFKYVKLSIK